MPLIDNDELTDSIYASLEGKKKKKVGQIDMPNVKTKDTNSKTLNATAQVFNQKKFEKPTTNELNEWFGHIKELAIEVFYIETRIQPNCEYCEAWKNNTLERKWLKKINELLGINESCVSVSDVLCDWNCLHGEEYIDPITKQMVQYPLDLDQMGEDYFYATGMDIDYFPAIRIKLKSTKYKNAKETFEAIFQGIGSKNEEEIKYQFNGNIYGKKKTVIQVKILKSLLKFLKSISIEDSDMPIHEKFSLLMGQVHRHGE
jgi:hypothetical protein